MRVYLKRAKTLARDRPAPLLCALPVRLINIHELTGEAVEFLYYCEVMKQCVQQKCGSHAI